MKSLNIKAFAGLLFLLLVMAAALFLSSWSIYYWQAWVFLGIFGISVFAITLYLVRKDPKLLERRVQAGPIAEKEKSQKIIQSLAQLAFIVIIVFPAIDHRFGWSATPLPAVLVGNVLVLFGLYIVFCVFKENTFTSATIEVGDGQKVISTGPYGRVRHPMYSGALIMLFGVPLALGSWWGLIAVIPIAAVIVWRLFDEESFLEKNLRDYLDYEKKVKYRLIPFVW
jgi:protein-S-isoprenylcysteine O-methyltransferase Ste14